MPARRKRPLPQDSDPILARIRFQRRRMGLSFHRVAIRAGIKSPAYVFHIENGDRVPSGDVAARLAGALGLDERLLTAWARALQRGDLMSVLGAAEILL